MKTFIKNAVSIVLIAAALVFFLTKPKLTGDYAYIGLDTWYKNMIISLLPIMILVNLLQKSGLYKPAMKPLCRLLYPVFRLPEEGIFVLFFGFLAGFPMGAKIVADLYRQGKLTQRMAEYLLAFTNNIGPAYFTGFVLIKICPLHTKEAAFFLMYGIPLLYGILLRHTVYRSINAAASSPLTGAAAVPISALIPDAVSAALSQIAMLGGYMIFFNALRVIPHTLFQQRPVMSIVSHTILEISGGLKCLQINLLHDPLYLLYVHAALSFGGLCCFFQTASLLADTTLSASKYLLHKVILCAMTCLVCLLMIQLSVI